MLFLDLVRGTGSHPSFSPYRKGPFPEGILGVTWTLPGGEGKSQQVAGENSTSPSFHPSVAILGVTVNPCCVLAAGWEVDTGPQESLQHQES